MRVVSVLYTITSRYNWIKLWHNTDLKRMLKAEKTKQKPTVIIVDLTPLCTSCKKFEAKGKAELVWHSLSHHSQFPLLVWPRCIQYMDIWFSVWQPQISSSSSSSSSIVSLLSVCFSRLKGGSPLTLAISTKSELRSGSGAGSAHTGSSCTAQGHTLSQPKHKWERLIACFILQLLSAGVGHVMNPVTWTQSQVKTTGYAGATLSGSQMQQEHTWAGNPGFFKTYGKFTV